MPARRLLLLRHAKAEPAEYGTPDFDRPLIKRGRQAAKAIGRWLRAEGIAPDRILCSPSARTRETLEGVVGALEAEPKVLFPEPLYNASAAAYLDAIRAHGGRAGTLMVVGHNPATEEALLALAADRTALPSGFPTGGLAILEFDGGAWKELAAGSGRLTAFVDPRALGD